MLPRIPVPALLSPGTRSRVKTSESATTSGKRPGNGANRGIDQRAGARLEFFERAITETTFEDRIARVGQRELNQCRLTSTSKSCVTLLPVIRPRNHDYSPRLFVTGSAALVFPWLP